MASEPVKDAASAQQDHGCDGEMGRMATVQAQTMT